MAWAGPVTAMEYTGEQDASRPTSVISVTLYTTPGRHTDAGTVRAAIVAALDRRFPGVDSVRVTVDLESGEVPLRSGRGD